MLVNDGTLIGTQVAGCGTQSGQLLLHHLVSCRSVCERAEAVAESKLLMLYGSHSRGASKKPCLVNSDLLP